MCRFPWPLAVRHMCLCMCLCMLSPCLLGRTGTIAHMETAVLLLLTMMGCGTLAWTGLVACLHTGWLLGFGGLGRTLIVKTVLLLLLLLGYTAQNCFGGTSCSCRSLQDTRTLQSTSLI